jgi:hypothetical protein
MSKADGEKPQEHQYDEENKWIYLQRLSLAEGGIIWNVTAPLGIYKSGSRA